MVFFFTRVLLRINKQLVLVENNLIKWFKKMQKNVLENLHFLKNCSSDKKITNKIPVKKLKKLFDFSYHTKKINIIFRRVFK
jgi:adenylosuccinate lyase